MDMELAIGIATNHVDASHHIMAKGKRTKRLRHLSPCAITAAISSSSSASEEEEFGISRGSGDCGSFSSTTTATTFEVGTDLEEEDMANCLILLAQGKRGGEEYHSNNKMREKSTTTNSNSNNNKNNRRFSEVPTAATKVGFYVYECKTCNRAFPSFQALGGHRASHKKPKLTPEEKKSQPQQQPQVVAATMPIIAKREFEETKQGHVVMTSPAPISLQLGCGGGSNNNNRGIHGGNNKEKVHECSICGSEFTSGQALGGHMRRHRASIATANAQVVVGIIETTNNSDNKPRNVLELDLNLPAPADVDDDHRDSKFHFTATHKSMLLSAPALVGCHY